MARTRTRNKQPLSARQLKAKAYEKEIRAKVAILKSKGVFTNKVDARKQSTRYQRSRVRRYGDVLEGIVKVVRVKPAVRKLYEADTAPNKYRTRDSFVLLPAEQKHHVNKAGYIVEDRGNFTLIKLPFKLTTMQSVVKKLKADPTLGGLRTNEETFAFRLYGHSMRLEEQMVYSDTQGMGHTIGFSTVKELADYVELKYKHLFSKEHTSEAAMNFELMAFKIPKAGLQNAKLPAGPRLPGGQDAVYNDNRPKTGWQMSADGSRMVRRKKYQSEAAYNAHLERDKTKKSKKRDRETPTQSAARRLQDAARHRAHYEAIKRNR